MDSDRLSRVPQRKLPATSDIRGTLLLGYYCHFTFALCSSSLLRPPGRTSYRLEWTNLQRRDRPPPRHLWFPLQPSVFLLQRIGWVAYCAGIVTRCKYEDKKKRHDEEGNATLTNRPECSSHQSVRFKQSWHVQGTYMPHLQTGETGDHFLLSLCGPSHDMFMFLSAVFHKFEVHLFYIFTSHYILFLSSNA